MNLESLIATQLQQIPSVNTYWLGFSGGLDSEVLLAICQTLRQQLKLQIKAIHLQHGLSLNASLWAAHCRKQCEAYQIPYHEETLTLDLRQGDSLEAIARQKRYHALKKYVGEGDVLLTAHHQDDQAETILLQLFRGAGLSGLSAMPMVKPFAKGFHLRPMLMVPRAEIQAYAKEKNLSWMTDESNDNCALTRNFLRHEVIPLLQERWPTFSTTLSRSGRHFAEAQDLLEEYALEMLEKVSVKTNTLSVAKLSNFSPKQQRLILRFFIKSQNVCVPNEKRLKEICKTIFTAARDRVPMVEWNKIQLKRYRDELYIIKPTLNSLNIEANLNSTLSQKVYEWALTNPLELPYGTLSIQKTKGKGLQAFIQKLEIRFRQGGEILFIQNRGHRSLKKLFQEWGVLPWERKQIPLIYFDGHLRGVVGYHIDPSLLVTQAEEGREITYFKCDHP